MAVLTTKKRENLPDSAFVYPPTAQNPNGRYPIHDRKHAANALARVAQFGTPAEQAAVKAAVCKKYPDFPICGAKG
jgi:hypothetical protein